MNFINTEDLLTATSSNLLPGNLDYNVKQQKQSYGQCGWLKKEDAYTGLFANLILYPNSYYHAHDQMGSSLSIVTRMFLGVHCVILS